MTPDPVLSTVQVLILVGGSAMYAELVVWYIRRQKRTTPAGMVFRVTLWHLLALAAAGVLIDLWRVGSWAARNVWRWFIKPDVEHARTQLRVWRAVRRAERQPTMVSTVAVAQARVAADPPPGEQILAATGVLRVREDGATVFELLEVG